MYKGWHWVTEPRCLPGAQCFKSKQEKISVFCVSLPIRQVHSEHCILNSSLDTAGFIRLVIQLLQNMWKCSRDAKNKKCVVGYFVSLFSHFAPGSTKHEIWMKYNKCIVGVMYFVVCIAKTIAKYEKCIASLTQVARTPTKHEFLWVVCEWRKCSTLRHVHTTYDMFDRHVAQSV